MTMTITNEIINSNPDKYETVIQSRILDKQLQMKLNQYTALQRQYDTHRITIVNMVVILGWIYKT